MEGTGAEDGEVLMRRAGDGDREAYAKVVEQYEDRIRRLSYLLLHDSAAAEDVTQETFTRGLERIDGYRGGSDPSHWFYAIALNLCREGFRRARRKEERASTRVLESGRSMKTPPRGILTSMIRRETRVKLTLALGYLTEGQREAFVLHYVEGLPYDAIAPILGLKPGAVRALSHRAREVLRQRLGDDIGRRT